MYNYSDQSVEERPIIYGDRKTFSESVIAEFSELFIHSLREMREAVHGEIKVALTGGTDSRTLLSLIKNSGVEFSCYTFETEFMKVGGDIDLPPILCERIDAVHELILLKKKNYSRKRYVEYIKHSAGMANDGDLRHYSYGQYDRLCKGNDIVVLYSGIWECCIEYYLNHSSGFKKEPLKLQDIIDAFHDLIFDDLKLKSVKWWLEYIHNSKYEKVLTDCNRFYMELRDGCWMSYISQAFDVMEHVTMFQPCNSRLFIRYLIAFPADIRERKEHQKQIIAYNAPELANVPYTDEYEDGKKIKLMNKLKGLSNRFNCHYYMIKWYGFKPEICKIIYRIRGR